MKQKIGIVIETDVLRRAKRRAIDEGRPLSDLIQDALDRYPMAGMSTPAKREDAMHPNRRRCRVSNASAAISLVTARNPVDARGRSQLLPAVGIKRLDGFNRLGYRPYVLLVRRPRNDTSWLFPLRRCLRKGRWSFRRASARVSAFAAGLHLDGHDLRAMSEPRDEESCPVPRNAMYIPDTAGQRATMHAPRPT